MGIINKNMLNEGQRWIRLYHNNMENIRRIMEYLDNLADEVDGDLEQGDKIMKCDCLVC